MFFSLWLFLFNVFWSQSLFLCVFIVKTKVINDILMMIFCCIVTECGHVTRGRSRVSNPMSCSHWTDWCSAASLALICGCVNSAQTGSTGPETSERSLQNKTQARLVFTWRLLKINSKSLKTEKQADQIVWTFMLYQSVMFLQVSRWMWCFLFIWAVLLVTEDWCSYDVVFLSFSVAEMCWRHKILEIISINDVVWNRNEDKSIKDSRKKHVGSQQAAETFTSAPVRGCGSHQHL